MKVTLGKPVVVAQGDQPRYPWGIWQFPNIVRLEPDVLVVSYNRSIDSSSLDTAKKLRSGGLSISRDGGRTWKAPNEALEHLGMRGSCVLSSGDRIHLDGPPSQDIPKDKLPAPAGRFHDGYDTFYTARDRTKMPNEMDQWHLVRHPGGRGEWERLPVTIEDPDWSIVSFDPPGKAHAVVHRGAPMQIAELPDRSLLAVFYGNRLGADRKPHPKCESWCVKSTDGGLTWKLHGIIARDDKHPLAGYTEPNVAVVRDGSLLAVLRTECATMGPMCITRSTDGGKTWDRPKELYPFGVLPKLLALDNGVIVLSFGRPGAHLVFNGDGKGQSWEKFTTLVAESFAKDGITVEGRDFQKGEDPQGRPKQTRTSGYTALLATGPDSFLIAYDQFDYPNEKGEPRKTILVQSVVVSTKP